MPMIAITTISSTSVKPGSCAPSARAGLPEPMKRGWLLPAADIGIGATATFLAVGAPAPHVGFAVLSRRRILIRASPRIVGQLLDVPAGLIMRRIGRTRRRHQRLQSFRGAGIAHVLQL